MDKATQNGQAHLDSVADHAEIDHHIPAPKPDPAMLYGIAGEVGRVAAETTEANAYATTAAYLCWLSSNIGRDVCLPVGNTWHHARLNFVQVGRTGRGRKGDALSLLHRIRRVIEKANDHPLGQTHTGGLSSREGLTLMIHDGYTQGKDDVPPIHDKRLWIVESEFANVLHQAKRDGNTLSAALRDAWDGVSIKPATKSARVWATDPHITISAAITPSELLELMKSRELTNGFANRFIIFWAERDRLIPFPQPTPEAVVEDFAERTRAIVKFAKGSYPATKDSRRASLSPEAAARYQELYRGKLNASIDGGVVDAILERRAPTLLRLALLFALTDQTLMIERHHIDAALAWVRYWTASVRFIFAELSNDHENEKRRDRCKKILAFIQARGEVTRTQIYADLFKRNESTKSVDEALDALLAESPPRVELVEQPKPKGAGAGRRAKIYRALSSNRATQETQNTQKGMAVSANSCVQETQEYAKIPNGTGVDEFMRISEQDLRINPALEPQAFALNALNAFNEYASIEQSGTPTENAEVF